MNRTLSTFLDFVVIPAAASAAVVACHQITNPITAGTLTETTLQVATQVEQLNQLAARKMNDLMKGWGRVCLGSVAAIHLPTEHSPPQQWRGFYCLHGHVTKITVADD